MKDGKTTELSFSGKKLYIKNYLRGEKAFIFFSTLEFEILKPLHSDPRSTVSQGFLGTKLALYIYILLRNGREAGL